MNVDVRPDESERERELHESLEDSDQNPALKVRQKGGGGTGSENWNRLQQGQAGVSQRLSFYLYVFAFIISLLHI